MDEREGERAVTLAARRNGNIVIRFKDGTELEMTDEQYERKMRRREIKTREEMSYAEVRSHRCRQRPSSAHQG